MTTWQKPPDIIEDIRGLKRRVDRTQLSEVFDLGERPDAPTNVTLTFRVKEKKTRLEYKAVVKFDPTVINACLADIDYWMVQIRATNAAGTPLETETEGDVLRRKKVDAQEFDDTEAEFPHAVFPNIEKPKVWYWQARVRIIDKHHRKGLWSDWTDPLLPVQEALPKPPTPTGVALSFDRREKNRHLALRAVVVWDEVGTWDVPGFDEEDDVDRYVVQFRPSNADGSFDTDHKARRKVIKSEKHEEDANDTVRAIFPAVRKRQWYRARVKTVDRWNRPGDWSDWTPAGRATDNDNPPAPSSVEVTVKQRQIVVEWEQPLDADDPDGLEIDDDIAYSIVELATNAGFTTFQGGNVKRDRFVGGTKKMFKVEKPGNSTFYARVKNVDAAGNKSGWTEDNDQVVGPTASSIVSIAFDKIEGTPGARLRAVVTVNPSTDSREDISRYIVQFAINTSNALPSPLNPRRKVIENPDTGDAEVLSAVFAPVRRHRWCFARVRPVNKEGNRGTWSAWTSGVQAADTQAPAQPVGVTVDDDLATAVIVDWTDPTDPENADTADLDIHHYEVQLSQSPSFSSIFRKDRHVKATKKRFKVPRTAGPFYARVRAVSETGTKSADSLSPGATSPRQAVTDDVGAFQITPGRISTEGGGLGAIDSSAGFSPGIVSGRIATGTGFPRVELTSQQLALIFFYGSSGHSATISMDSAGTFNVGSGGSFGKICFAPSGNQIAFFTTNVGGGRQFPGSAFVPNSISGSSISNQGSLSQVSGGTQQPAIINNNFQTLVNKINELINILRQVPNSSAQINANFSSLANSINAGWNGLRTLGLFG